MDQALKAEKTLRVGRCDRKTGRIPRFVYSTLLLSQGETITCSDMLTLIPISGGLDFQARIVMARLDYKLFSSGRTFQMGTVAQLAENPTRSL
jgi:hypothetical protein